MDELNPTFTRLSKDDLLSRCLKGMTQNQNEAVNGQLWSKCSKTKLIFVEPGEFILQREYTGAASKAVTMELCQVSPGVNTMKALRQQDKLRIQSTSQKISKKYRKERQNLCSQKKSKRDEHAYQSGAFSLSSQPDKCVTKEKKRNAKYSRTNLSDNSR